MPGDVSKGHTRREEAKAIDALTRDAQRSGTVPLADKKPSVLPTLKPITAQVRKLELPTSMERAAQRAVVDQGERELKDRTADLILLGLDLQEAEERGESITLSGERLTLARRCIGVFICKTVDGMLEGGGA